MIFADPCAAALKGEQGMKIFIYEIFWFNKNACIVMNWDCFMSDVNHLIFVIYYLDVL